MRYNVEHKQLRQPRWASCGKCHKFHKEGSKIQIAHAEAGHMGKGYIRWTTTDPNSAYRGGSF